MSVDQSMSQLSHEKVKRDYVYHNKRRTGDLTELREEQDITQSHILRQTGDDGSLSWPFVTFFILIVEICERFCYYGLRNVLTFYCKDYLGYPEATANTIYHAFGMISYLAPIFGAIVADNFWGRYKTIRNISVVYIIGTLFITLSAVPSFLMTRSGSDRSYHKDLLIFGLMLTALGAGGIKPCVGAFGADQFPDNAVKAKENFFKWFYMCINLGALAATIITPKLAMKVDCFTRSKTDKDLLEFYKGHESMRNSFDQCHVGAYGLASSLMIMSLSLFLLPPVLAVYYLKNGDKVKSEKFTYKITKMNDENIMKEVSTAIATGVAGKIVKKKIKVDRDVLHEEGFLIYSSHDSARLRRISYQLSKLSLLFVPLVGFWFVNEQMGSTWIFQARESILLMNFGFFEYYILPNQMGALNCFYVITLIILWTKVISPATDRLFYPIDNPKSKRKPLHMIFIGLLFSIWASYLAFRLQADIDKDTIFIPKGDGVSQGVFEMDNNISWSEGNLEWKNPEPRFDKKVYEIPSEYFDDNNNKTLTQMAFTVGNKTQNFDIKTKFPYNIYYPFLNETGGLDLCKIDGTVTGTDYSGSVEIITYSKDAAEYINSEKRKKTDEDDKEFKNKKMYDKVDNCLIVRLRKKDFNSTSGNKWMKSLGDIEYEDGKKYILKQDGTLVLIVRPRRIHIWRQVLNYLVLTCAEVCISTTCLEFAYTQSTPQVKAVCTGLFYLSIALANLLDLVFQNFGFSRNKIMELSIYLAALFTLLYTVIAWSFTVLSVNEIMYLDRSDDSEEKLKLNTVEAIEHDCNDGSNDDTKDNTKIIDPFRT